MICSGGGNMGGLAGPVGTRVSWVPAMPPHSAPFPATLVSSVATAGQALSGLGQGIAYLCLAINPNQSVRRLALNKPKF